LPPSAVVYKIPLVSSKYPSDTVLNNGAKINVKNNVGVSPLYGAAKGGHINVVKKLIEKGADVNTKNEDGISALQRASETGHKEIVQMLKRKGAK
jgi:ankyrin repeat protein